MATSLPSTPPLALAGRLCRHLPLQFKCPLLQEAFPDSAQGCMRGLVWALRPPSPTLSTGVGHSLGLLCLPFQTRLYSGSSREAGRQPCCQDDCEKTGPHPQTLPQRGQTLPPRSPSSKGSGPGLVEGPGEKHGGLLSGLRAGAVIWKVICADSYQLEDAHGLHMVFRRQPREGCPQGHGQHPEGRLLGTEQAPGHRARRQGHLRTHCSRPGGGTRA